MTFALVAPWTRLYSDIKISVPGVSDAVLQQELYRVVKDFFETTNIWQETVPITGQKNVVQYPFTLAGKGVPNRLVMLYNPAITPPNVPRWIEASIGMQTPGVIDILYAPSETVTWNAVIAKSLDDVVTTNGWPDIDTADGWIIDKYRDCLTYGTLARFQRQPTKPYSNIKLSEDNQRNYIVLRGRARTDALKQNAFGGQAWTFPQGFATVTRKGWT